CRESIPEVERLYKKYHSQGLEVVGISVDTDHAAVPAAAAQLGITYPVMLADSILDIRHKFQFDAIPQLYAIDKQGRVALSIPGADPTIEDQIAPLLKE
ncbi:MAG TPA: TlpA disulfide reductase family protein, partial [Chthonomonadaceae bacterium]|nr:TlpA disulfide reductase family protein [Chthonomonadaceae bacterium]